MFWLKNPEGRCNFRNEVGECRLDSCNSGYGSELGYIKNGNKPARLVTDRKTSELSGSVPEIK